MWEHLLLMVVEIAHANRVITRTTWRKYLRIHGMEEFGLTTLPHLIHGTAHHAGEALPVGGAVAEWLVGAIGSAIVGLIIGAAIVGVLHLIPSKKAH